MIADFLAYHHILHVDVIPIAAGTSAGDDDVGPVFADHFRCTDGGIHLADAAFFHNDSAVVEQVLQLLQLFVHGYDNSNFHLD